MGTDKARLLIDGQTMLERAVAAVRQAQAQRIIIVGWRPKPALNEADGVSWGRFANDVAVVPDRAPGSGPLGGLVDGMLALTAPPPGQTSRADQPASGPERSSPSDTVVLVVACDHPDLDPVELMALAKLMKASPPSTAAVIPTVGGRMQPLHAAYRLSAVEQLGRAFDEGERSVVRALNRVARLTVDRDAHKTTGSYRDLDTPQQLTDYLAERPTNH